MSLSRFEMYASRRGTTDGKGSVEGVTALGCALKQMRKDEHSEVIRYLPKTVWSNFSYRRGYCGAGGPLSGTCSKPGRTRAAPRNKWYWSKVKTFICVS